MTKRALVLVVLILAVSGYTRFLSDVRAVPLRQPLRTIPLHIGEWKGVEQSMSDNILRVVGVEDYIMRTYRAPDGFWVSVYVGYYEQQKEGDQIHSPKHCLPGSGWGPKRYEKVAFPTPGFNGGTTRANRYVVGKGKELQLVLYWYQSRGRNITNEYLAKMWMVLDSIFRRRTDGSLIRLIGPLPSMDRVDETYDRMVAFAQVFLPEVQKCFPE